MTETLWTGPPESGPETEQAAGAGQAEARAIAGAGEVLRTGGVVILPTDTVYGLAALASDEYAVARLSRVKGRDPGKPLAVLVADPEDLSLVADALSDTACRLIDEFFPGPLTVVVPRSPGLAPAVTGGRETVGVRCPDHEVTRAIIRAAGFPIAATSANPAGGVSPRELAEIPDELVASADLVVDGGPCPGGVESTVVDATTTPPRLLRRGAIGARIARWLSVP